MDTDFSLENILKITKQNDNKDSSVVDYHYNRIIYKIKDRYANYYDHLYYEVDNIVPRLPMYNSCEIADKLVDFMTSKDFKCKVFYQNKIYVWWNPKKRRKLHIDVLLKTVFEKIHAAAIKSTDFLVYEVPVFLSGFPWYDVSDTARIIGEKLMKKKFIVNVSGSLLYVSWKKEEIENRSNIRIKYKSNADMKLKALQKINYINESRYKEFMNPKKCSVQNEPLGQNFGQPLGQPLGQPNFNQIHTSNRKSVKPQQSKISATFLEGLSSLKNDVNNMLNKH